MNTDKSKTYRESINELFSQWKMQRGTIEQTVKKELKIFEINHADSVFISDGVVCPEKWFSQNVRPLYLLKEAYGGEEDWSLIDDHLLTDKPSSKMWKRISEWTYGLMTTTEEHITPYTTKLDHSRYGNEYLKQIAVVNIKKSGGENESDMDTIRAYAAFDRCRLKKELELCVPTVIICGYTISALDIILGETVQKERNDNLYYHIMLNGHDVIVIDYWHPANQYPDVMNYYGLLGSFHAAVY
ncbi:MAG: hypothetical protein LUE88_04950 [Clostridiales bacterium]|nr:hypothetical protein [Clostridiales bacterium]